jgi:hypothetical protein
MAAQLTGEDQRFNKIQDSYVISKVKEPAFRASSFFFPVEEF